MSALCRLIIQYYSRLIWKFILEKRNMRVNTVGSCFLNVPTCCHIKAAIWNLDANTRVVPKENVARRIWTHTSGMNTLSRNLCVINAPCPLMLLLWWIVIHFFTTIPDLFPVKFVEKQQHVEDHKYRVHSGIKPWVCQVCGKAFPVKHSLTRHKLVHTGEKLFACRYCGKRYQTTDILSTHQRSCWKRPPDDLWTLTEL